MDKTLDIREEASLVLGFRLPDDPLQWYDAIMNNSVSGMVDQNKKFNLTIMLLMRMYAIEKELEESKK